jgi:hypothetical protein
MDDRSRGSVDSYLSWRSAIDVVQQESTFSNIRAQAIELATVELRSILYRQN